MKIVQIIPGSGGSFYCGNCLRDSKFVEALRKEGHQVVKVPMYLPLFANEDDTGEVPVFYGAISIYLKQRFPIFRKAPRWVDKLLNSKPMLKLAAGMAGSTDAQGLDEMTVSMLLGEDGKQREELEVMVDWIAEHLKPDVVHISNALLLGLAHKLREKIGVPIICSLQDEDVWVDVMKPSAREQVWNLMHQKSADVDAFIAVSKFFGGLMQERMKIPAEKLHQIYLGVDPAEYSYQNSADKPRTIGYISRMCSENGYDIVVDAFIILKQKPGFDDVTLTVTGGFTPADTKYIKMLKRRIARAGLQQWVDYRYEAVGQPGDEFFSKVAVASVPVRNGEAFGLYLPELMSAGIPVVQPALGAFPEIVALSGGGTVYEPNTPEALAGAWAKMLANADELSRYSQQARAGVESHFNIYVHTREMIELYESLVGKKSE